MGIDNSTRTCGVAYRPAPGRDIVYCVRPEGHDDELGHDVVRYPAGTPEHAVYVDALRVELVRFARREHPYDVDELADAPRGAARAVGVDQGDADAVVEHVERPYPGRPYPGDRPVTFTNTRHVAAALRELADTISSSPYGVSVVPLSVTVSIHTDRSGDDGLRCSTVDMFGRLLVGEFGSKYSAGELYSVSGVADCGLSVGVYAGGLTAQGE